VGCVGLSRAKGRSDLFTSSTPVLFPDCLGVSFLPSLWCWFLPISSCFRFSVDGLLVFCTIPVAFSFFLSSNDNGNDTRRTTQQYQKTHDSIIIWHLFTTSSFTTPFTTSFPTLVFFGCSIGFLLGMSVPSLFSVLFPLFGVVLLLLTLVPLASLVGLEGVGL